MMASALQDLHIEIPAIAQRHGNPQWRSRSVTFCGDRAQQECWCITRSRMDLQPADLFWAGLWQPRYYRSVWVGLDQLFGGPKPFSLSFGIDPHKLARRYAELSQTSDVWSLGWRNQVDLPSIASCSCEAW